MRRILATVAVLVCVLVTTRRRLRRRAPPAPPRLLRRRDEDRSRSRSPATASRPTATASRSSVGQPIELVVKADEPGEIHVHSTPSRSWRTAPAPDDAHAEADRQARHHRGRVARPGEDHRPARSPLTRCRTDGISLAHGIGGAKDLPISPELAIAGAVAALTVSFTVLAIAWRTPRYDAATSGRPAPRPLAAGWSTPPGSGWSCGWSAWCSSLYAAMAAVAGQGPADQPDLRHLLRVVVGRPGPALAAARPGLEGDQPGPHDQPGLRPALRQRPGPRRLRLPRAAGPLAGRGRACSRSCGWSWSTRSRPSSGRSGCGARSTSR